MIVQKIILEKAIDKEVFTIYYTPVGYIEEALNTVENEKAKNREKVIKRIQRMEGQLRGIRKMVEDDRECKDILTQMLAVSGAMRGTISTVIKSNLCECVQKIMENDTDGNDTVEELVNILSKAL